MSQGLSLEGVPSRRFRISRRQGSVDGVPRIPRSRLPSPAWYHVICRGVEQRPIVLDDRDREAWFKLFLDVGRRFRWRVHAWNLLDNHFHLLVETTQPELSRGMQRLNGVYAMRFNRRYARSGHLFQGRFESRVVEGDAHLDTVVEYIFENTTRVGLTTSTSCTKLLNTPFMSLVESSRVAT